MKKAVVFQARREGYGIDQICDEAMTVGQLIRMLEDFDEDRLFVLSHDSGYTYGSIKEYELREAFEREDGEWEFGE